MDAMLAIFDVDGTLVDSRTMITECCQEALTRFGLPEPDYEAVRQIVGLGLNDALSILAPGTDGDALEAMVAAYKAGFIARVERGFRSPLYDGAAETLARLKAEGWLLSVATGKTRRGLARIVAEHGWEDLFVSTHCDDDGPGKPHPAMVLEALKASAVGAERALMIGDSSHDMRMARAGGVYAVGVAWGFHTPDEVTAAGAHQVAHDFNELDRALDRFAAGLRTLHA